MEQSQQKDYQSNTYLNNNLSSFQLGLVQEISSVFGIMEYVKQVEDKYNPKAPKDSLNKTPDSILPNQKPKADSPGKDSPPRARP
jgi:hypothetical protein